MKIETPKNLDNIDIVGNFDSIQAGIDATSLSFILELLSKNFYSNPIGSICREITSNCFDSHIEANVDEPVIIKIDEDEEGEFISFTDVGVGLTPDRIKNIYMKYFTSTKRDTNDQIGGFGLGSKTPLAYQDYFYIITVVNNIKYSYLFSKGSSLPTLDLLCEEEIEQRNGTEIKIYIKNNNDKYTFINELKSQLSYFDNVWFENCDINNDYKIYENNLFKYRNQDQYSNEAHICFGKVSYPIDWNKINVQRVDVPIGIKFRIDELVVTPNREALRYTDEVTKLVHDRVLETIAILQNMYIEQQKSYDDFFEWYKYKTKEKYLYFGEDKLQLKGQAFKGIGKETNLKILEELGFDNNILDGILTKIYKCESEISVDKIKKYCSYENFDTSVIEYSNSYIYSESSNFSAVKNYYHRKGRILQPYNIKIIAKNILKNSFVKIITNSILEKQFTNFTAIYNNVITVTDFNTEIITNTINPITLNYYEYYNNKTLRPTNNYFNLGIAVKIYKLIKYIRQQVESKLKNYHIEITDEFKEIYKNYNIQNDNSKKRKLEGKVFCKGISTYGNFDWRIQDIEDYTGIVVYGFAKDTIALNKTVAYCYLNPKFRQKVKRYNWRENDELTENGQINRKACTIIQIAQNNAKYFKNKKNMVYVKDLYGDNKLFRKIASSFRIASIFEEYLKAYSSMKNDTFIFEIEKINTLIGKNLFELHNYYQTFTTSEDIAYSSFTRGKIRDEIISIANKHNLFDITIEAKLKVVEDYFKGIELLKHIEINNDTLPLILKYLREKKKKINLEYYQKVIHPELTKVQMEIDFEPKEEIEIETKFRILTKVA